MTRKSCACRRSPFPQEKNILRAKLAQSLPSWPGREQDSRIAQAAAFSPGFLAACELEWASDLDAEVWEFL